MRFRMVFAFDPSQTGSPSPWKPKETDIEPLDICGSSTSIAPFPAPSPAISPSLSPGQGAISMRPRRGVRWASDSTQPASNTPTRTSSSLPLDPMMTQIQSICTAFKDSKGDETCLGFIVDESFMRHQIYPTRALHPGPATSVSLYKRLTSGQQNRNTKLTRKERLQLALTLASTVLQLHKTPWLSERWGKKDILFLNGNVPYVSRTFLGAGQPPAQVLDAPSKSLPVVRNETIFALGVILIELCLGSALEEMRSPEDLSEDGTPNALTDYLTARRMINEVYDEGGGRYGDAVRRCVHCEFDQRIASLDVEVFRKCFYQGVVQPLEDDWMDFSSMNPGPRVMLS